MTNEERFELVADCLRNMEVTVEVDRGGWATDGENRVVPFLRVQGRRFVFCFSNATDRWAGLAYASLNDYQEGEYLFTVDTTVPSGSDDIPTVTSGIWQAMFWAERNEGYEQP